MTIIQSINPMTSKMAATIEGAGAGALLGAGIGYMIARKPSEDKFVKNALESANKALVKTRKNAAKILKQMNQNKPISEKLLKSIANQGYTVEELYNKENIKQLIMDSTINMDGVDNGKRWKDALKRLGNSTHPDKENVVSSIKYVIEEKIKPIHNDFISEIKRAYKAGGDDETYKFITSYMKKKAMGKFAAIGAVALGVAGYFASKYLNIYPKQKNI